MPIYFTRMQMSTTIFPFIPNIILPKPEYDLASEYKEATLRIYSIVITFIIKTIVKSTIPPIIPHYEKVLGSDK